MQTSPFVRKFRALAWPPELRRGTKAYDFLAAIPLLAWYSLCVRTGLSGLPGNLARLDFTRPDWVLSANVISQFGVLIFSLLMIVLLIARRPAKAGAAGWLPRAAAILGTYLSVGILLLPARTLSPPFLALSAALILAGTLFAAYTLAFLGRSFSIMAEARKLVTAGPYAVVRHPLYLAEQAAIFGIAIRYWSVWTALILAAQVGCQLYRMGFEERILTSTFPEYATYGARVRRIIPGIY